VVGVERPLDVYILVNDGMSLLSLGDQRGRVYVGGDALRIKFGFLMHHRQSVANTTEIKAAFCPQECCGRCRALLGRIYSCE
jgi:hypothetical protein